MSGHDFDDDVVILPHIVVDGKLQRPVGFVPLREWVTKAEAKRLKRKAKKKARY